MNVNFVVNAKFVDVANDVRSVILGVGRVEVLLVAKIRIFRRLYLVLGKYELKLEKRSFGDLLGVRGPKNRTWRPRSLMS